MLACQLGGRQAQAPGHRVGWNVVTVTNVVWQAEPAHSPGRPLRPSHVNPKLQKPRGAGLAVEGMTLRGEQQGPPESCGHAQSWAGRWVDKGGRRGPWQLLFVTLSQRGELWHAQS